MSLEKNGKYVFGTVRVGERGQIVIPKQCREIFDIKPGDTLLILGDEAQGIGIMKQDRMMEFIKDVFAAPLFNSEGEEEGK
jgi:AbrB family looped-hinge helix DNA binding protein